MSASLVGSEMCIRDSSGGEDHPGSCATGARWAGAWDVGRGRRRRRGRPVSYTHLTLPTICSV
eukprot:7727778-Alexandrium_andersonii.AAC.1